MKRWIHTFLACMLSLAIVLLFSGFGQSPTLSGALHSSWNLVSDTVRDQQISTNYYGTMGSNIWFSVRLILFSVIGACLLGFVSFCMIVLTQNRFLHRLLSFFVDCLEVVPSTLYIIGTALSVIILIEKYQIYLPGIFPDGDPTWQDTLVPALALSIPGALYVLRILTVTLRDEETASYVAVAYAKGMSKYRVYSRHIIPNVLSQSIYTVPVITSSIVSSALFTEFFFGYQGTLFHFNNFADWAVNTDGPLIKPNGIPTFNIGSIALAGALLVGAWLISHIVTNIVAQEAFPSRGDRQPGVFEYRIQKSFITAGVLILSCVLIAGFDPHLLTPHSPYQVFPEPRVIFSKGFPFGLDEHGHDILAQLLYGTIRTLTLAGMITILITMGSLGISVLSIYLDNRRLKAWVELISKSLSPVPALAIVFLAMMHSPKHQTALYVFWVSVVGIGRGAYAFQGAMDNWMRFRFIQGTESIGAPRGRVIFRNLGQWVWRFTTEFTFTEVIRVLAIMIELASFRIFPSGEHLTWLSVIGPIISNYSYINWYYFIVGPLTVYLTVTLGAALVIKGIRGTLAIQ